MNLKPKPRLEVKYQRGFGHPRQLNDFSLWRQVPILLTLDHSGNRRTTMKASMTAVLLFFVLGVSNGRSRFSSSEVNDVDVDAENVTSPEKRFFWVWHRPARPSTHNSWNGGNGNNGGVNNNQNTGGGYCGSNSWNGGNGNNGGVSNNQQGDAASTEKRFFWVWHRPARPSTHNTWNGGNNSNGGVNNNQNTGGGYGGSNSWNGGNGNNGPVSNNQQGDASSPEKRFLFSGIIVLMQEHTTLGMVATVIMDLYPTTNKAVMQVQRNVFFFSGIIVLMQEHITLGMVATVIMVASTTIRIPVADTVEATHEMAGTEIIDLIQLPTWIKGLCSNGMHR
ncbi:PREDICTED: transcription factor mef2A-like isoform X14 [Acropora digitifera]|uniref:transcription factor mef2A-like isoform X14 n=1 Tax=Acropora digitifera TaxID=70779 RepID=UPI00077A1634|nr:PREDICTED: transcription factor mef2A-like isoform X14 [Acropora digitifera]